MSLIAGILFAPAGLAAILLAGTALYLAVFLPLTSLGARLLPDAGPKSVEGIKSIDEAVAAGKATGLEGAELAAWAQGIAARRFEYSRRNPWDSPARCFERGYGYCIQQARALELLLTGLGIESRLVQAFRCRFPPKAIHGEEWPGGLSGHAWLRARIGGLEYDLCPGDAANSPGRVHFEILSTVRPMPRWSVPILHILSVAENARRDAPR